MAEPTAVDTVDPNTTAADMDVENTDQGHDGGHPNQKRSREEDEAKDEEVQDDDVVAKKQKVDQENEMSVEEKRLEKLEEPQEGKGEEEEEKKNGVGEIVKLGPKSFGSSLEMFNYFFNFLNVWPHYLNINKYEHMVLLDLLKKGHLEPDKKIGVGIRAFQIRKHPIYKSKCFFLIRQDDTVDDFSFRKCVDHILPLPEEMQLKSGPNKVFGGGGGGRHGHGGRGGRGRGGRGRHGHGRGGRRY